MNGVNKSTAERALELVLTKCGSSRRKRGTLCMLQELFWPKNRIVGRQGRL